MDALGRGCTVSLSGAGGVGKTSIGATVIERLDGRPAFWYTLRPGFNDGAGSLLIALGAFLHQHGAAGLWQYLLAANGDPGELDVAAGLLRQDLASLSPLRPLICIDDLEHVSGAQLLLKPDHIQVLDLIDSLRGTTSLLLIGQRSIGAADLYIELGGLDVAGVERLWRAGAGGISPAEAERMHALHRRQSTPAFADPGAVYELRERFRAARRGRIDAVAAAGVSALMAPARAV